MSEPGEQPRVPRMTDDELRTFVIEYCNGALCTSAEVPTNMLGSVFMVLMLGALAHFPVSEIEQIGLIWEHRSEANRLAVNGFPTFFSCRLMHREDWERVKPAIGRELERRKDIEL